MLTTAAQRLSGVGGDPVLGLQTAFGGGKTHTMLALYHLARFARDGGDPRALAGMSDVLDKAGVASLAKPKIAVFVGSGAGPDVSLKLDKGPRVHTVWGYLAWRLAGEAGLKLMAEAEAARTSPGSALLVDLFKLAGPSLILLDELTMFARQLDDTRFEAFLSFIQSLTEAAKMAPGVLVVGSLPESDMEAGGPRGADALRRMEKVFGRVQSPWLPASGDETYEIIRRRLFQPLDADGEKARDETVKAFADMYRKNAAEFPPEAKEKRYEELLRLSYPIHPELFDRLSKDWATLEKFQRTRGVLRFLANVVGVLWHSETSDPMITPARVPVAHERVRASMLYPLDPAFGAVVDREVDGDGSLPSRMEINPSRRISQARAATRAARAVFLCTAPLVGQANHGVTGQGLRLACAEPGDQLAIFGEALRELTERAAFLYEEAGRYWFSTQPTLNRLAEDRARAFPDHEVDDAIVKMLAEDAGTRGGFSRVFPPTDDPTTIDEAPILSLAILGPSTPHAGRGVAKSLATDTVTDVLTRCRASQRKYRNTLLFVAADEAQLATARDATRRSMAWASIVNDTRFMQQQLTQGQAADAQEKARNNKEGARRAIRAAWSHVLYAVKTPDTEPGKAFDLEHLGLSAKDRNAIPAGVYDKAKADDIVKERLGAESLWLKLKDLWPAETPHLADQRSRGMVLGARLHAEAPRPRCAGDLHPRDDRQVRRALRLRGRVRPGRRPVRRLDLREGRPGNPRPAGASGSGRGRQAANVVRACSSARACSGSGRPDTADFADPKCARLAANPAGADQAAQVLRFGRDRHEPAREGLRRDPERCRDGTAEEPRREGQADARDRGRGAVRLQGRGCRRRARQHEAAEVHAGVDGVLGLTRAAPSLQRAPE